MQVEVLRDSERKPLGLIAEGVRAELDEHLPEEVVAAEPVVVPHGDLQVAAAQLRAPDRRVDERLAPARLERVGERLGAPLRLLAARKGGDRQLET